MGVFKGGDGERRVGGDGISRDKGRNAAGNMERRKKVERSGEKQGKEEGAKEKRKYLKKEGNRGGEKRGKERRREEKKITIIIYLCGVDHFQSNEEFLFSLRQRPDHFTFVLCKRHPPVVSKGNKMAF